MSTTKWSTSKCKGCGLPAEICMCDAESEKRIEEAFYLGGEKEGWRRDE